MTRSVADQIQLFREYADLERKRCGDGVTPLEYLRWLDLDARLSAGRPGAGGDERRLHKRHKTTLRVEFGSVDHFRDAYIRDLSRGGVFVATPFAAEIGTELVLRIRLASSERSYEMPGVVVTNNVGDGFTTRSLGMGVHFRPTNAQQRNDLEELVAIIGNC